MSSLNDFDLSLLCRPDHQDDQYMPNNYFDTDCPLPQVPFADSNNLLSDLMLNPFRVKQCSDSGEFQLLLCSVCHKKLMQENDWLSASQIVLFWEMYLMN